MKRLSDEEKWNWMSVLITFPFYAVCIILAVLALYFTSGPTPEDVALGGEFMLALAALVIAAWWLPCSSGARDRWTPSSRHCLSDWLRRK